MYMMEYQLSCFTHPHQYIPVRPDQMAGMDEGECIMRLATINGSTVTVALNQPTVVYYKGRDIWVTVEQIQLLHDNGEHVLADVLDVYRQNIKYFWNVQ